jgi:3-oxoacyl-[acyl-carrier protein] reductase
MKMHQELADRVALVSGAASGIGRAIAILFAREGAKVAVVDKNLEGAESVVKEIEQLNGQALALQCDVSEEKEADQTVKETGEQLGNVGILVNCAGIAGANLLVDMTTEEWHSMLRTHLDGTFFFSRAIINGMKDGDRIINMSSIVGIEGQLTSTHYAAAKGAIIAFTKSLAMEVARRGVTVNAIAPGIIRTPMMDILFEIRPDFEKEIPAFRCGKPEDIAELALFLASRRASYITGQVIVVDGGFTLVNPVNQPIDS